MSVDKHFLIVMFKAALIINSKNKTNFYSFEGTEPLVREHGRRATHRAGIFARENILFS